MDQCLAANSAFSRAVYKLIRPRIPKGQWPPECIQASFSPGGDGLVLDATFSGFSTAYAALAGQLVREARLDLVLPSPVAAPAAAVVRARRWRDSLLYAFLPLLFAIPILGSLGEVLRQVCVLFFCAEILALLVTQLVLMGRRSALAQAAFKAEIPVPGLRIRVPAGEAVKRR